MPFRSEAQRRFLYARHPDIAERWQEETPEGEKLPPRASVDDRVEKLKRHLLGGKK